MIDPVPVLVSPLRAIEPAGALFASKPQPRAALTSPSVGVAAVARDSVVQNAMQQNTTKAVAWLSQEQSRPAAVTEKKDVLSPSRVDLLLSEWP